MFRRKKKEEEVAPAPAPEVSESAPEETPVAETAAGSAAPDEAAVASSETTTAGGAGASTSAESAAESARGRRGNRVQKIGIVASDKMQKTVLVRVDRLVRHPKYRRYVRRTSKFMAHDDLGSTTGDRVRIVETRPLSARKRWRVVEIVQKAAK